ncbi:MAG: DNA recombination protein RmuC [Patescibacteria group bacterium]|nr:DNA recombination protein RmuC [Patescibacteria group bacterium]
MSTAIFIIFGVFFLALVGAFFMITKKIEGLKNPESKDSNLMLQQQMDQMAKTLDRKLSETHRLTQDQLKGSSDFLQGISQNNQNILHKVTEQSQKTIQEVTEKLTKLDETNRRVVDFSSQLKDLQDILKNPKQRGVLGEYYLEETLKNVLPPNSYQMQYKFKDAVIVDAVVFVKDKIIPIDSKFSLEGYEQLLHCKDEEKRPTLEKNFKQDLKNRIDETSKYIKPNEKTVDFAFMFIPSESIYYDLLVNKIGSVQVSSRDLIEYAFKEKHVIIVSPTSFLAYLQTVLHGLNALKIEESVKIIQKNVEKLDKHLRVFESFHEKVGNSLSTTVNHYNKASKEFKKVDKDVVKITEGASGGEFEEVEIEKPKLEE